MPESYFEGAEITIDAQLSQKKFIRTTPYTGPVKLTFSNEKGTLETKNVNATKGKFDAPVKFTAPAVDKTLQYYTLQVICSYKKVNKLLLQTMIWPKEMNVTINDQTGQPKKACPFIVRQEGVDEQLLSTDQQGKCAVTLMARKAYSIHMAENFKILELKQQTPGQYRDHILKVDDTIVAQFVTPKVDAAPYVADPNAAPAVKQWVNLRSANTAHEAGGGCDAKGSVVVCTVSANPAKFGKKGDKIYFQATFGRESKRYMPAPGITNGLPVLDKVISGKVTKGYVILEEDEGSASFEVSLGIAGGDTCEIKIGGTPEVKDAKVKFINWRKMYAQVTKTAATAAPGLDPAIQCLKAVFIDFEESTADAVTVDVGSVPAGSIADGRLIRNGLPQDCLVVGDHNVAAFKALLKPRFASENLPCAHLIYCNEQLDADNAPARGTATLRGRRGGQTQSKVVYPGGGTVPGVKVPSTFADASGLFFSVDMRDGSDAVKSCTWRESGGGGASGDITSADYIIQTDGYKTNLFIRLPAAARNLSDAGSTILVDFEVAYSKGWYNGWCTSGDRHLVIKVGRPDNDICGTIVHEVGHAISQSAVEAATYPGLKPPHDRFYTNNRGHSGPHCADGIDDPYYDNLANRMDTDHASQRCTCIMYGSGAALRNQTMAFCAKCQPFAKAAPISNVST